MWLSNPEICGMDKASVRISVFQRKLEFNITEEAKMLVLQLSPLPPINRLKFSNAFTKQRQQSVLRVEAMTRESQEGSSGVEAVAIVGGLVATPVIGWSLYTLMTTGCGLPPGPGGSIGALEGVSYLVVVGIVGWSLYTKTKTGSGLPNGPFGLLGAVEGLSYLSLLAIIVVFGLQFLQQGSIPGPLPTDQCFG